MIADDVPVTRVEGGEGNAIAWQPGIAPVAVVMISLNESHNIEAVLENIKGWAQEVFLVDSYSRDDTVDIALSYGVHVVQRRFRGFGDQWNFALRELPISAPWTMKVDPDERLTDQLKKSIVAEVAQGGCAGISFYRCLWFMGCRLPIRQEIIRMWRSGSCRFTDVSVNEHPLVEGDVVRVDGDLEHHDSPDLHHWVEKQNRYTSIEALARYRNESFAARPSLVGTRLERRMWLKKHFNRLPLRYFFLFVANFLMARPWTTGYAGFAWARLRVWVRRMIEDKLREMRTTGRAIQVPEPMLGPAHPKARQCDL